ncbi:MAG: hypothetical protein HPY59_02525 [Anaerolineae bacterium]|nr:hypothetical protein [Anaerolineae bacterium]
MSRNTFALPWINQIRRNHALEHAALQLLAKKRPGRRFAGYSDPYGFWVIGDVPTSLLQEVIGEAVTRLKAGEKQLAVHPNCGTNFATAGLLAGTAAWLAMVGVGKGWRQKLDRFPLVVLLSTLALIIAQPLGLRLQSEVTTLAQLDDLRVTEITCTHKADPVIHRVRTHQGG